MTETKILAGHRMNDAQSIDQHIVDKAIRRQAHEPVTKGQHIEPFNTKVAQQGGRGAKRGEPGRRRVGRKDLTWMRLEGDDTKGDAQPSGVLARSADHGAMSAVNPVKITDGDGGPTGLVG